MIKKIIYILDKKQKIRVVQLFIILILGSFVDLLGVAILLPIANLMIDNNIIFTNFYLNSIYKYFNFKTINQFFILLFACVIAIYILKDIFVIYRAKCRCTFTTENQFIISTRLMQGYLSQPYIYHVNVNSAELLNNILTNVNMFFTLITTMLEMLSNIFMCIMIGIFLLFTETMSTFIIGFLLLFLSYGFIKLFKRPLEKYGQLNIDSSKEKSKNILQAFAGIKEIKLYHNEKYFSEEFNISARQNADIFRKYQVLISLPSPLTEMICISILVGSIIVLLSLSNDVTAVASKLVVFAVSGYKLLPLFGAIASGYNTITFNKISVNILYNDISKSEKVKNICFTDKEYDKLQIKDCIDIRDIVYSYPNANNDILNKVSLKIPVNKSVAFIGPSGSGKTTLVDILIGLLTPQCGSILVDGVDIQSKLPEWQMNIGYIAQFIYLIDDTIKKNVAWGRKNEEIDEKKVWTALEKAQLSEFVKSLEKGLDTVVGERGAKLSGGQRQRIGIARALYDDPQILVFDEATSALDSDTETAVMESIEALYGQKTLIIIAHRLTTIRNCDSIYEIKEGKALNVNREMLNQEVL